MTPKQRLATIFTILSTISFVCSLASPWWLEIFGGSEPFYHNCWIDGVCRGGEHASDIDHGHAQFYYSTLAIEIGALVVYVTYIHLVFMIVSTRYNGFPGRKILTLATGIISLGLIAIGVIVFAIGVPKAYTYTHNQLFGSALVTRPSGEEITHRWGAHVGWFLAILTIPFLATSIFFTMFISKPGKPLMEDSAVQTHIRSYGTQTPSPTDTFRDIPPRQY